ncbi:Vitamin B12 transporter BtuB [Mucisphaera calidilacus]|uniref:Vitamin B12 transporter BtuB n=1 Tax=Mucisphaera calidilacus TaxID=2527982 RepID=A0A518C0U0_9BACT|nr:Vitamin B12 transporter BtuB [Mucisphaera calidilacus]
MLRGTPGLHVAQIRSDTWSVSARGFGGEFNNKMLVQMDGRSLYTPLFGGVYWGTQDYILQDLEVVEVIRGPGGTLWGANAVNGSVYYTDNLRTANAFVRTDLGVTWKANDNMEFSLVGQNLLDSQHAEATSGFFTQSEVPRSIFARLTFRY